VVLGDGGVSSRIYRLVSYLARTSVDLLFYCRWMLDTGFGQYL